MRLEAQEGFAYRFDWGVEGLRALAPSADVVVIVDVLLFSTVVSAAVEAGAIVSARAGHDGAPLDATDALSLAPGSHVVLPASPGHELAIAAAIEHPTVLAGCVRNATATALLARELAGSLGSIALVAAGERWSASSQTARVAVEDALGAGAIISVLDPSAAVAAPRCSPEAAAARATFRAQRGALHEAVADSASGRMLSASGRQAEIAAAAALDTTSLAALLVDGAFTGHTASVDQP